MRNIVFTRIDDRLIHGQVMTAWVHETKANEIVIIDNEVAQDDFLKMIMTSSAPAGIKVLIMSEEQAIDYLTQEPDRNKLIVLAKNPKVIKNITDGGVKIEALNVGGMGARKDRTQLYRNISVSDEERACFKQLITDGTSVYVQVIPEEKSANIEQYLEKGEKKMEINVFQALLIGLIYYLSINGTPWLTLLGSTVLARPLICGTLVGLVLGDVVQGCVIGAAISLPYLAYISAGGTVPMDPGLAGTLGTALAMAANASPEVAVSMAVPIGLLGTVIWIAHMTVDISFLHMIDKAADDLNSKKIDRIQMFIPQLFLMLISVIPVFIVAYFGSGVVKDILDALEGKPLHVLEVIGGVLPALGVAMILKSIMSKDTAAFYFLGFVLAVYLELPIIAVSILAFITAFVYTQLFFKPNQV